MAGNDASTARYHQHERHQFIIDQARSNSRVEVTTLAEELDVTTETIRRDLTALERRGFVRRVHGGAIHVDRLGFEPSLEMRSQRLTDEKERVGLAALAFLPPGGGSIIIDGGTTTMALVRQIPMDAELTVVTNSLPAATYLADRPSVDLHLIGGRVRSKTHAGVGRWAADALSSIAVDVAFMGTNGLSRTHGLTTPDMVEADTKRAMIAASRQVVVLADHTKLGASYLCRFADLRDLDAIVTDTGLDEETADEYAGEGPQVVRA